MTAFNDRFWAKVLFKNFIKHYRKLSNDERLADIEASMDALEDLDDSGSSFGAKMVKWSMERADEPFAKAARANGKKGGRPRKNTAGAPNGNNGDESATACGNNSKGSARPSTDGDTRKDSRNITGSSNGASLESATSVENHFAHEALDCLNKASDKAASNTGNVKPVTCRESGNLFEVTAKKSLAGGMLPSSSLKPPASPGAVDVLSLSYSGEFQNVKLTQEQYAQLGIRFGNLAELNRAIDSLSCKLENEEIKPVPKNHYAVLLKWASYREDMDEKKELEESKPKMTNMEKSWIAAMKRVEEM